VLAGTVVVALWAIRFRPGACGVYAPSGWVYVGLFALAFGLLVFAAVSSLSVDDSPRLQRIFVAIGLAEAAGVLGFALYFMLKVNHSYACG